MTTSAPARAITLDDLTPAMRDGLVTLRRAHARPASGTLSALMRRGLVHLRNHGEPLRLTALGARLAFEAHTQVERVALTRDMGINPAGTVGEVERRTVDGVYVRLPNGAGVYTNDLAVRPLNEAHPTYECECQPGRRYVGHEAAQVHEAAFHGGRIAVRRVEGDAPVEDANATLVDDLGAMFETVPAGTRVHAEPARDGYRVRVPSGNAYRVQAVVLDEPAVEQVVEAVVEGFAAAQADGLFDRLAERNVARRSTDVGCHGGGLHCLGVVSDPVHAARAEDADYSAFPYCPPCRVEAHADSVQDEPEQGPRPLAPSRPEQIVDDMLDEYRRGQRRATSEPYGWHVTMWVEYRIRQAIEIALVGLPTGGGTDRDRVAERLHTYAEALRILTARTTEGTLDDRLYAEVDEF